MTNFADSNWYVREPFTYLENPPFKYPNPSIRFLDAQKSIDVSKGVSSGASDYTLHRGYLRNLQPATLKASPIYKCKFQFNPQEISQSVSMREDIYNPVLLTPEQLSQPIGGTVNFQFDLLFDRSHEMSEDWDRGALIWDSDVGAESSDSQYAANKFGVFADLKMLYSAIGQGISNELIQQQINNIKGFYEAKAARDQEYTGSSDDEENNDEETTSTDRSGKFDEDFDVSTLEKTLTTNLGNSAFLIPNPIRIVFSDLFMVDGFVTGTRVDYLKFNNYMIPMQCRVALSVNAMYIGFAKNRTFLTTTISDALDAVEQQTNDSTKAANELQVGLYGISPFVLALETYIYNQSVKYGTDWNDGANGKLVNSALWTFLIPESRMASNQRTAYSGFKGVVPIEGDGKDIDPILTYFEDVNRAPFTISYSWSVTVYGKVNQNGSSGQGWTQQEAAAMLSNGPDGNPKYLDREYTEISALYQFSGSAIDRDEWGYGASGSGATADKLRRLTYKRIPNEADYELNTDDYLNAIANSYYVVVWDLTIRLSTGNVEYVYKETPPFEAKVRRGTETIGYNSNITLVRYAAGVV